jgi:hypothetical protein
MYIIRCLIAVLLVLIVSVMAFAGGTQDDDGNIFWRDFRKAILTQNNTQIISMTRFPLTVRGVSDNDPVKHVGKKAFIGVFRKILVQAVTVVSGDKFVTETMLDILQKKEQLQPRDYLTKEQIRVEQFLFQRINGRWLLTTAYLEE